MFGLLLGGLGAAATGAGLTGLGAGLTAAGQFMGGSGIPGIGGATGAGGVPTPPASPFGMSISDMVMPRAENLGTSPDGWQTSVTPEATDTQKMLSGILKSMQAQGVQGAPQAAPMAAPDVQRRQVDPASLLAIVNRRNLGT